MSTPKEHNGNRIYLQWNMGNVQVTIYMDGCRCYNHDGQLTISGF